MCLDDVVSSSIIYEGSLKIVDTFFYSTLTFINRNSTCFSIHVRGNENFIVLLESREKIQRMRSQRTFQYFRHNFDFPQVLLLTIKHQ